jgi:hypothetical protein
MENFNILHYLSPISFGKCLQHLKKKKWARISSSWQMDQTSVSKEVLQVQFPFLVGFPSKLISLEFRSKLILANSKLTNCKGTSFAITKNLWPFFVIFEINKFLDFIIVSRGTVCIGFRSDPDKIFFRNRIQIQSKWTGPANTTELPFTIEKKDWR